METTVQNRAWVKNVAIILLAVLLALTFFSNTILNRSLPEVATQSISSGTITARIRGTGIVSAVQSYDVSIDQSRKIKTVLVRQGQEVRPGDVLFILADQESDELSTAQDTLRQLNKQYQTALINAADSDYARENLEITRARENLSAAESERNGMHFDSSALVQAVLDAENARQAVAEAEAATAPYQEAVDTAQLEYDRALAAVSAAETVSGRTQASLERAIEMAEDELAAAQENLTSAQRAVDTAQDALTTAETALDRFDSGAEGGSLSSLYKAAELKKTALTSAQSAAETARNQLETATLINGEKYNWIAAKAESQIQSTSGYKALTDPAQQAQFIELKLPVYLPFVVDQIQTGTLFPYDAGTDETGNPIYDATQAGTYASAYQAVESAQTAVTEAEAAVTNAQLEYDQALAAYNEAASRNTSADYDKLLQAYHDAQDTLGAAKVRRDAAQSAVDAAEIRLQEAQRDKERNGKDLSEDNQQKTEAERKLTEAQTKLEAAKAELAEAQQDITEAETALDTALAKQSAEEAKRTEFQSQVEAAGEKVKSAQHALEDLLLNLQLQQKSDQKQAQLDQLDREELTTQIEKQEALIQSLSDGSTETEIRAEVSGVIESLNVNAGNTATPGVALASIQVPDMGYTLSFSVTNDQAQRVHAGDVATAANYYYGSQIDAVLANIRTDPKDPQGSKLLNFEVSGDVTPGSNLTLSVGQRSAEYDYIIPNSALRSDANGDFVLVVTAKSSPLGDRYTATRVDVTKLAADDTMTAVTGALNYGDFVITTSSTPIQNGDRVRLADTQTR